MLIVFLLAGAAALGAETPLPPATGNPMLVLDQPRPHARVAALAFSRDGSTLYAGGHDKLVRRYALVGAKWVAREPLRVPLGLGNAGAVNAVAASPDGKWVAFAGRAPLRGEVGSGQADLVATLTRGLSPALRRDYGVIYLLDTTAPEGAGGRVIRGLQSEVRALAFSDPSPADGPALVAAGFEWDANARQVGTVRVFDVNTGKELGEPRRDFPTSPTPPGLGAWATAGGKDLRVAVAWEPAEEGKRGNLVLWNVSGGKPDTAPEAAYNSTLAVRRAGDAAAVITGGFHYKAAQPNSPAENYGLLTVRPAGGGKDQVIKLQPNVLPRAVVALPPDSGLAAAFVEVSPPAGAAELPARLGLIGGGAVADLVPLSGVALPPSLPVLAASPDGRFVAVAGFADHRVEVYEVTQPGRKLARAPVQLPGEPAGFARVRFLAGDKLWLGGAKDAPGGGGIVFDFPGRAAAPNDGKGQVDAPKAAPVPTLTNPDPAKNVPGRVSVLVGNAQRTISLPEGERPTAAAVHPSLLGADPVVAVAHTDDRNARTLITLYSVPAAPAAARPLLHLAGPSLPVAGEGLAFSGTKPLLAAVGADRAVFVWSLRDLGRTFPVLDGVVVTPRKGEKESEVLVAAVSGSTAAAKLLKEGDVIEAVGPAKGELKPVKTTADLVVAVRGLAVGARADVKVKGQAAPVAVPVAAAVGYRPPLVSLWIDPAGGKGQIEWVGWTQAGPYDASSPAAEARIGWVSATGNPARPIAFAGAAAYQGQYYKKDVLRFVLDKGDVVEGLKLHAAAYPPKPPVLAVNFTQLGEKLDDGRYLHRQKPDGLDVGLVGRADGFALDDAVLRWRPVVPGGAEGPVKEVPFSGRANIDLKGYDWPRGERWFRVALHLHPEAPKVAEYTVRGVLVPPAPALAVSIDKRDVKSGDSLTAEKKTVVVAVDVKPGPADVAVYVRHADGSVKLVPDEKPAGVFAPVTAELHPVDKTTIVVTATTRGPGVDGERESRSVEVVVFPPPPPIPPPAIALFLATPHDPPATPDGARVVRDARVRLAAVAHSDKSIDGFEWDAGDKKGWVAAEPVPFLGHFAFAAKEVGDLPPDGEPLAVGVRARVKDGQGKTSEYAAERTRVAYAGLAEVRLRERPPAKVATPELKLAGSVEAPAGLPVALSVVVTSARGDLREKAVELAPGAREWQAVATLFPGENTVSLVVRNAKWPGVSRRVSVGGVTLPRPPVAIVPPLPAGTGSVADVTVLVVTHPDVPPTDLIVDGRTVLSRRVPLPSPALGLDFWLLTAAVDVETDGVRAKAIAVAVRNAEAEHGGVVAVPPPPPPVPAPTIVAFEGGPEGNPIKPGGTISTDQSQYTFHVRVASAKPLTRAEVWRGTEPVPGLGPNNAVKAGSGFELTATVTVELRRGVNTVKVAAGNGGDATLEFLLSYTPPPVRVFIDAVTEPGENGPESRNVVPGQPIKVKGPVVEIRGRVVWDADDPASRAKNLQVVFDAEGVTHLPVDVPLRAGGSGERAFTAPVFLNARETHVRIGFRAGGQSDALPQQGRGRTEWTFQCANPLLDQRLHALVIAPGVSDRDRAALARKVVAALGGSFPDNDREVGDEFKHPLFRECTLYRPAVGEVDPSHIAGLLGDLERRIRRTATQKGGQWWFNDVVVVYYQGDDESGKDGHWLLGTSRSLYFEGEEAKSHMVRVSDLRPVAGLEVAVLNVSGKGPDPGAAQNGPIAEVIAITGVRSSDPVGQGRFLDLLQDAVKKNKTFGEVDSFVARDVKKNRQGAKPLNTLPEEHKAREIGLAQK